MTVRLAHAWSSDLGIPWTAPYDAPLLERGWEICNITPDGEHARRPQGAGNRWLPHRLSRGMHPVEDAIGASQLLWYFGTGRFDIVHTHAIKVGLVGRVLATLARVPILVHTMHGLAYSVDTPQPKRAIHAAMERLANLRTDAIFAQSHEDAETMRATKAVDPSRIVWVGNGIPLGRFDPSGVGDAERRDKRRGLGLRDDEVLFLTGGRLVREKGMVELIEAAIEARREDPRARLAIAGEVDDAKADAIDASLLSKARKAGVLVLGRRSDMPELLAAADVATLVSWREGLPRFLMEGAAMGKALLASDARGCREVCTDGEDGLRVPVRDSGAITRAMLELTRDGGLRRRLGETARATASQEYDLSRVVARVVAVYDRLLSETDRL